MATEKVSLSLDEGLVTEARRAAGSRGLSSYVNRALGQQLQRDRLSRLLVDLEAEHGPIEPQMIQRVRQEWPADEEKLAQRRSA